MARTGEGEKRPREMEAGKTEGRARQGWGLYKGGVERDGRAGRGETGREGRGVRGNG